VRSLLEQDAGLRRVALRTPSGFLAIGMGAGLSRYAPGTVGTLMAVPFALLLARLPPPLFWTAVGLLWLAGIYLCGAAARMLGRSDPGNIVWDEMAGYWVTVSLLPPSWEWWLAGFVLFRMFDILKPWPIRALERRVKWGLGIMLDDLVAAVYALLTLDVLQRLL